MFCRKYKDITGIFAKHLYVHTKNSRSHGRRHGELGYMSGKLSRAPRHDIVKRRGVLGEVKVDRAQVKIRDVLGRLSAMVCAGVQQALLYRGSGDCLRQICQIR